MPRAGQSPPLELQDAQGHLAGYVHAALSEG